MASPATARKPRKARRHLKAGLPAAPDGGKLYAWDSTIDGGYAFNPVDDVSVVLTPGAGTWAMLVQASGKRYVGSRATLEEAYKAACNLLYKVAKDYWLRMDGNAPMKPWAHTLPED